MWDEPSHEELMSFEEQEELARLDREEDEREQERQELEREELQREDQASDD